jgi:LmbE family N-acetylglucosaminyl deacetylase
MSPLSSPPGQPTRLHADETLVLAPHFDDELLGCGGLLLDLLSQGGRVHVLYLSDGGGDLQGAERQAYSERRRQEAQAVAGQMGLTFEVLGLPDGRLGLHLPAMAEAIASALALRRPELLLIPSPLEASADHRAAFAAVHRALSPLRPGDPLLEVVRGLPILTWEANFPLRPDLLVDVSAHVERLGELMALHASQQEQKDYWGARRGLLKFRSLTLPLGASAAEAYGRLTIDDFRLRPLSSLVEGQTGRTQDLVVESGPSISLIVRTKNRPGFLAEALASVAAAPYAPLEVLVVNDGGTPPVLPADFPATLRLIDLHPGRGRAGAANAGLAAATGDYVAFLDDDDRVESEHFATLARLVQAPGVRVAYTDAAVGVYALDGADGWRLEERRLPYSRDFDPDLLLVDNYIPFHTLLIERRLALEAGNLDETLPFFEDWDFLLRLAALSPFHHLRQVTCEYRQFRGAGHHVLGDRPRERGDFLAVKARVLRKHAHRLTTELLARVVDGLNAEKVAVAEEAAVERRAKLEERERVHAERERFHALNGQLVAVEGHNSLLADAEQRATRQAERLQGELLAKVAELEQVRAHGFELDRKLEAAYGEIGRLDQLVKAMTATRAWRLHSFFGKFRR